jgi:hypothetical protein
MKQKSPTFVGLFSCYTLPVMRSWRPLAKPQVDVGQQLAGIGNLIHSTIQARCFGKLRMTFFLPVYGPLRLF